MKRVLVIDDEPNVRTVLKMLLEDDGYEVMTAENGERAMAAIDEGPDLDLVISDLKMPGRGRPCPAAPCEGKRDGTSPWS